MNGTYSKIFCEKIELEISIIQMCRVFGAVAQLVEHLSWKQAVREGMQVRFLSAPSFRPVENIYWSFFADLQKILAGEKAHG